MKKRNKQKLYQNYIQAFRRRLATVDALPQLAILGLLSGLVTGVVILLFRLAIEWPLTYLVPNPEAFEQLTLWLRMLLPFAGACLLGAILYRLAQSERKIGVAYVMERLSYHQGYISWRSALLQFVAGVITIGSGQSAGREGPAVHLGAACSSLLGRGMALPNNSIRTLVACGTGAAISASFNTPIAGVIFAMEVVMMEYTIIGFTPVILASVTGALITQASYGSAPAFEVPALTMNSLLEVPYILLGAVVIGVASAGFVRLLLWFTRFSERPVWLRLPLAGVLMMPFAALVPEVMGIGYDTVNATFMGEIGLVTLLVVAVAKLLVTATTTGLGMPNGLIGPILFIGATLGGALGIVGGMLFPEHASSTGFYAMLGMGAMMGAVLQAPLAALMALLELTQNPNIILPGMLMITTATMVSHEIFGQRSLFLSILRSQGLEYQSSPIMQALQRVGVGAIIDRSIRRVPRQVPLPRVRKVLKDAPRWLVVDGDDGPVAVMPTVDLARYMEENNEALEEAENSGEEPFINLLSIPAQRRDITTIPLQATLQEALDRFTETGAEAMLVQRTAAPMIQQVLGVVVQSDIENYYQYRR